MRNDNRKPAATSAKGERLEVDITALDSDGFGLGLAGDRQIRIAGGLPGDRVLAEVEHAGKRRITARTARILTGSPERTASRCTASRDCDGCNLINLNYRTELQWKHEQIANQIHCHPALADTSIEPVLASPEELGYRNSAKLVISGRFDAPIIGIYRRGSHNVVDISSCPLHHPLINRIAEAVKRGIVKCRIPIFHPRSGEGLLRYLQVRVAVRENTAMVTLVVARRSYNELHHLTSFLTRELPEIAVVTQNINGSAGNVILGDKDIFQTKSRTLKASLNEIGFLISPRSFFQINSGSAALLYRTVRNFAALTGRENILDLYCGVGAISLHLARKAASVLGVESVEPAVADAFANARLNRIRNCHFIAGDAGQILESLRQEKARFDVVVINPPRKGCDPEVIRYVAALSPTRIIYVSCSPLTLGRDLQLLAGLGYRIDRIQPVDMFPHTPHVENIALLAKN